MTAGIYKIEIGPYFYYGRAVDVEGRLTVHRHHLKKGTHRNPHMIAAFNKYGEFTTTHIVACPVEDLPRYEAAFVNGSLANPRCMNIAGVDVEGYHLHADETRRKMSDRKKAFYSTEAGKEHHKQVFGRGVAVTTPDDTTHTFDTVKDACAFLDYDESTLINILKGRRPWPKRGKLAKMKIQYTTPGTRMENDLQPLARVTTL